MEQVKILTNTNIKKLVFTTASMLDLSINQSLEFLQLNDLKLRIQMLTDIIIKKTYLLKRSLKLLNTKITKRS